MDGKAKEKGILKLDVKPRVTIETGRAELTPQGSCDRPPVSPQPSVDRLSVTWADPGSMTSSGVNLFHLPSETPLNEVKFSTSAGDGSEDEDYSASLSAVLRQRRASVRRSRKGRSRRPSSPFLPDENRPRRRSSVFTTSSGDTAISIEEGQSAIVTQEQIFENIHLHKEVLGSVKQQPLGMRRKLKIVHQAKAYIKRHEGQLQERLAQSKSTRDIYARFNILMTAKWQLLKREAANMSNLLIPWELRIKEIESHFGSVVASYFTFLRWLFWVNLVIGFILLVFVIVPEYLTANPQQDGERKIIMEEERRNATNLLTLWEFEGVLKCSPIFYGYYSNVEKPQYRMPLAYFLTGLVVYIYSFVAILRKMAENSRMSKLSEKEDECVFSWKLFTGWDFMIGNTETAHNRIASVILGFKEALLEEAEKKKDLRNWRIISLRALVNICVVILLAVSAYAVVTVVSRSDDNPKAHSWWRENETTIVVTVISITFPVFFELLGFLEHYHPRKQLRLQLARIMLLNLLNLYSLIFALFSKIDGMSKELDYLKPNTTLYINATTLPATALNINETLAMGLAPSCYEVIVECTSCNNVYSLTYNTKTKIAKNDNTTQYIFDTIARSTNFSNKNITTKMPIMDEHKIMRKVLHTKNKLTAQNLIEKETDEMETTTISNLLLIHKELERLRNISQLQGTSDVNDSSSETYDYEYTFYDLFNLTSSTFNIETTPNIDYVTTSEEFIDNNIDENLTGTEIFGFKSTNYGFDDKTSLTNSGMTDNTTNLYTDLITDLNSLDTLTYENNTLSTDLEVPRTTVNVDFTETSQTAIHTKGTNDNYFIEITENVYTTEPYDFVSSFDENVTYSTINNDWVDFNSTEIIFVTDFSTVSPKIETICPNVTFNCSIICGDKNITQVFSIFNCSIVEKKCYTQHCEGIKVFRNTSLKDFVYFDDNNRKMYNLTRQTKKKLLKLCWETMFGQELIKLTMMDLVFVLLGTLFMDFFRALFVRYMNRCWCWDLEKKFPEYGDFKIAENILHLINNQGMVWMGMFFSPGLVVLNVFKLVIMMYLRSWAVMTCNVPHEVVFRVSKSNNFYLALLLTMLFLCVLPVGYSIVWVKPSWHCGPFSEYTKIYHILTNNIYRLLPQSLIFALEYIASPAIVIPLLVLLILIIYYLTSLTNSLREANNDLKIQLRRERTEERRKMFQLADTRRRAGSSAMDNTPFARWKKALPSLPLSKSIDSDDRKTVTGDETNDTQKTVKKRGRGGIFSKIVGMALDKKSDIGTISGFDQDPSPSPNNVDDETDTDFHETLPKEVLKIKDIKIIRNTDQKKKINVEFKTNDNEKLLYKTEGNLKVRLEKEDERTEKKAIMEKKKQDIIKEEIETKTKSIDRDNDVIEKTNTEKKLKRKQTSESSTHSRQSDSIGSIIPVITISTTESDDEMLQTRKGKVKVKAEDYKEVKKEKPGLEATKKVKKSSSDLKSLRRQSSVESINENKAAKEKNSDNGHKYQYSL